MNDMRSFLFINLVLFSVSSFARSSKLSSFQQTVQSCLKSGVDVQNLVTLNQLYSLLEKHYPLRSNETLYREVLYKEKGQLRKLKFEKGKIAIFEVLEDDTLKLINNDARQKGLTDESSINQLLQRAQIQQDWLKVKEIRSEQTLLQFGKESNQIKSLTFEKLDGKLKLECANKESSDICLCRP